LPLAEPIVRLLIERGAFTPAATHRAALALACLAPGLVAFSGVNVVARAFFALGDTRTPMRVSVFCLALNLIISLLLIGPFRQVGLGIANSLTSFVNLWLLLRALRKKLKRLDLAPLRPALLSLAGATIVAGLVAWLLTGWWSIHWGHANLFLKLGEVFVPAGAALAVYGLLALWLRVPEAREVARFFTGLTGWDRRKP
jgi:putative peptidoglycan lipid II flippase